MKGSHPDGVRRKFWRAALLWLGCHSLGSAGACKHSEGAEKQELGRISFAIGALRRAPKSTKSPALGALEATACSTAEICDLKRTCVTAYTLHVQALEATDTAREGAASGDPEELKKLVALAEASLNRSLELTQKCTADEGVLLRKYHL